MGRAAHAGNSESRRRIAIEAARLIAEQGMRDYHAAKLKAAARLGFSQEIDLPRNSEIELALREHQRLFQSQTHSSHLSRLRAVAVEAMQFFHGMEPRLVGAVLEGSADEYSAVCLHLFADDLMEITSLLAERNIPFRQHERRVRLDVRNEARVPALEFAAGSSAVDITVFPRDGLRQAPLDRISEKPMRRASLNAVRQLLQESTQA